MLVLGVDPGSRITGFGLINKEKNELTCVHSGYISPPAKIPFYERIYFIFESMLDIMNNYHPSEMAIEDMFYAKNVKSSLKLGHARGVILTAAVKCGVRIFEYTPLEIKKSVVGYGRADKEQVRTMVKVILKLKSISCLDTSDALAAAICHLNMTHYLTTSRKSS